MPHSLIKHLAILGLCLVAVAGCGSRDDNDVDGLPAPPPPAVLSPAPAALAFVVEPASAAAGAAIAPSPKVTLEDALGHAVAASGVTVTVAILSNPAGGTLSGSLSALTDASGAATFAGLSIDKGGHGYTLLASASGLSSATSTAFDIAPPPVLPTRLAFSAQPTTAAADAIISDARGVQVTLEDALGHTVTSTALVTVAIASNPGAGALTGTATVAAVAGVATFRDLAIDQLGVGYTLAATTPGLPSATSAPFDIDAVPASDGLGHLGPLGALNFALSRGNDVPNPATLNGPGGASFDSVGHILYVADNGNNRILGYILSTSNDLTGVSRVASLVYGQPDLGTTAASTTASGTSGPSGVAVDPLHHRLFVADQSNNRVLVFDTTSPALGATATHVLGQPDFLTGAAGPTDRTTTAAPTSLAYDAAHDRLFVADTGNTRVLVFDASSITDGMAAQHVLGQPDFTSTGSASSAAGLTSAVAVAYDAANDRLFVADPSSNRVLAFNVAAGAIVDGESADHVLGQPDFASSGSGSGAAGLSSPAGLACDGSGDRLFVSDGGDNRVVVFDVSPAGIADGEAAANFVGQPDSAGSASATTRSGLSSPRGLGYDAAHDHLAVADGSNNRILLFDAASVTDGMAASDGIGHLDAQGGMIYTSPNGNDAPGVAGMSNPSAAVVDPVRHRLFVADTSNNRVLVFLLSTADDFTGLPRLPSFVIGAPDFATSTSPVSASSTAQPTGLAYDAVNDRLFVGEFVSSRVSVFDTSAPLANGMSAVHVLGQPDLASSSGATTASGMSGVAGLAYDAAGGRLFVADAGNHRVLVFDAAPAAIHDGMSAAHVLGQPDFVTATGGTSDSTLTSPSGVVLDAAGARLFVADSGNNRVLVFSTGAIADGMAATHVLGQPGFVTSAAGSTADGMSSPSGAAHDPATDRLFVTDTGNSRVLVFRTASVTDGMPAAAVLGQVDFSSNSGAGGQAGLSSPFACAFDAGGRGRLFVADSGDNRVVTYDAP